MCVCVCVCLRVYLQNMSTCVCVCVFVDRQEWKWEAGHFGAAAPMSLVVSVPEEESGRELSSLWLMERLPVLVEVIEELWGTIVISWCSWISCSSPTHPPPPHPLHLQAPCPAPLILPPCFTKEWQILFTYGKADISTHQIIYTVSHIQPCLDH